MTGRSVALEFRVLGPIELSGDGGAVRPGSGRQRALLAALLLHAGNPVSQSWLLEAVYGNEPPPSAVANLRTHVAGLRRLLRDAGDRGDRLRTVRPGYRLAVGEGELDLHCFGRLVAAGRAALALGDPAAAAERLGAALQLCRGPVLDDVPTGPALAGLVAGLEEQRLAAVEEWVSVRLVLGEHVQLAGELRAVLARHPLRERLWQQLMLALYRSGDTAAALLAYGECRRTLADRLGLEPGPDSARLHRAVLDRDPALAAPPAPSVLRAVPSPRRSVPRELPAAGPTFTGRVGATRQLLRLLAGDGRPAVVAVSGICGVGKTALAVRVAHASRARYPDGQLYLCLARVRPESVPARVLRHLEDADADPAFGTDPLEVSARLRSLLAGRRFLLVLDGVTDEVPIASLLPAGGGCTVLATSRSSLAAVEGAHHLRLPRLPLAEAVELLGGLVGTRRVEAEPAAVRAVARWCDGLPLALQLAGARLAGRPDRPVSWLADRLADPERRVAELTAGGQTLSAEYAEAYGSLLAGAPPAAVRALRLLGRRPGGPVRTAELAPHLRLSEPDTEAALDGLVEAGLLEPAGAVGYLLPALLRLYAATLPEPAQMITA